MSDSQTSPQKTVAMFRNKFLRTCSAYVMALFFAISIVYVVPPPKQTDAFFASWGLVIKEYGLDGVAKFIAKRMLQMITRDTVNWINGGFQGGPGFVTNPERFALQVGDAAFNNFLEHASHCYTDPRTGERKCEPLADLLCSQFRVDIQLALRSNYIGDVNYRCTLSDVVDNVQDFYDDFNKGGWNAWFSMTQTTGNTPFGAYLEAQSSLSARIGSRQSTWQTKQDWGNGLLSWDVCTATKSETNLVPNPSYSPGYSQAPAFIEEVTETPYKTNECPPYALESRTPGTIIQNQLTDVFGSGITDLAVADEINEIIGALLGQFTTKLFNSAQGLFGLKNKIDDNPGRVIAQVNLDNVLEPEDPALANYCGSFREGFMPTATLEIGGDATFTTNRRDVTVQPGDVVTYSWCGANANQYASSYTVRNDLSSSCADSGTNIPWIAQSAYGEQSATVGSEQVGCVYEITYASQNTAAEDPLTGNLVTESSDSKILVRVGATTPPVTAGQCTISEVSVGNLAAATNQINSEIAGIANTIGNAIVITSTNGTTQLTPVSPSGVAQSIQQQVASQIGCTSTSNLTFVVFQVSNPNALPPEMLSQLGDARPNQILVVLDSVGGTTTGAGTTPSTPGVTGTQPNPAPVSGGTTGGPSAFLVGGGTTGSTFSPNPNGSSTPVPTPAPTNTTPTTSTLPKKLGVYHWANNYTGSGNPIADGVSVATSKGFQTVRLTLSPRYKSDYRIGNQSCTNESLASIAAKPEWQAALSNPQISTYILTTYDAATFGDCSTKKYLTPSFFTSQNITAVENEYKNLAQYLSSTYKGTGKQFIISNWETDNDVYCGSAYNYINSASFRSSCNQNINTWFGASTFDDVLGSLTTWFKARERGIAAGEALVASGAQIAHAPEFVSVHMLKNAGHKDVLRSVISQLNSDYISYSAYESLNNDTITADIAYIRSQVAKPLIIGEYGYDRSTEGPQNAASKLSQVTTKLLENGSVSYAIIWQLFDQNGGNFGLYSGGGNEETTGAAIQTFKN